jgi:hypothetical protein
MAESKTAREFVRAVTVAGRLPALPPGLSVEDALAAAREQGLLGVLLGVIEAEGPPRAGNFPGTALAAERRRALVRTLGQIALCARALQILEARGIRALPLKGAALAETVYDVESERPMSDVDVLALERWPEGVTAFRAAGFTELARGDHAWAFSDPASGGVVELHRAVTSCPGLFPLRAEAVWARSREGRGQLRRLPSVEDLLVQLAMHAAFQHGLCLSLVQWLDFRRLLEREVVDPSRLLAVAAEARAEAPLAAALAVAEAAVAAPVPAALRANLAPRLPRGVRQWLEPRLRTPLVFVTPSRPDLLRVRWGLLAGRRIELLWRTIVVPGGPGDDAGLPARAVAALGRAARLARERLPFAEGPAGAPAENPSAEGAGIRTSHAAAGAPEVPFTEEVLRDCLAAFPFVSLTVTGQCMQPALAGGERIHLVGRARRQPRLGDVVLARHSDGLRLHRLVWGPPLAPGRRWRTKADRALLLDPALDPGDVLATVVAVESRPAARLRRPGAAFLSLARGVAARLRAGGRAAGAEAT